MWPFRKPVSLADSGILNGFTDYHSHLLHETDDGVQTIKEAVEALVRLGGWGVSTIWLTPHIMEDIPNNTEYLCERLRELKAVYAGKITLHLAAEYMLDNLFKERLATDDLLPLGESGNHLLVETSCFGPPTGFAELLKQIRQKGYRPVLAHPERYTYMEDEDYLQLKKQGVKFQLNLLSIAGVYGKAIQKKAKNLIKKGMYDVSGSDFHALPPFSEAKFPRSYSSLYSDFASKQGQVL